MFYYRVSNILNYLSLISQSLISLSLISQSMIYRLFCMCHSGACASIFRLFGNFFFFEIFPSSAVWALRARPPGAASAHARVFFFTFLKFFFFEIFPSFAVRALRARPPGAASAHARVFFYFSEIFFSKFFHLSRFGPCAYVPQGRQCACASIFLFF